jgi:hypothetical protein
MCPTLIALDLVVEVGSAAIPGVGKAITTGISESQLRFMHRIRVTDRSRNGSKDCQDVQEQLRRCRSRNGVGKYGKLEISL